MNNFNFIDNKLLILIVILSVFYILIVCNKKIVENFGTIPLDNLNNLAAQFITDNNTNLVLPFNNVDMKNSNITIGSELKIGNITLKVVNDELVIDKPIKSGSATIGKWEIRNNRMGIKGETDMLNKDKTIQFVDYDKDFVNVNGKICINNIETSSISPIEPTNPILISAPRLTTPFDLSTKKYNSIKLNNNELLYRGLYGSETKITVSDNWENTVGDSKGGSAKTIGGFI